MYRRIAGERPEEELYAVADDRYSLTNLAERPEMAAVRDRMRAALEAELRRTGDPRIKGRHEEMFYVPHEQHAAARAR